jgi:hypothetical protein
MNNTCHIIPGIRQAVASQFVLMTIRFQGTNGSFAVATEVRTP